MSTPTRRDMLRTMASLGAVAAFPASDLLAQNVQPQFVPVQLNAGGRGLLNPAVSALDQHEDDLLDDLLGGNAANEQRDLQALDQDFNGLLQNPGNPVGFQRDPFRREVTQVRITITNILQTRNFNEQPIFTCIPLIDTFVGHWYPCNDILEISTCETKIWNCFQGRVNPLVLSFYTQHLMFEMNSLIQFHVARGEFPRHSGQLLGLLGNVRIMIQQRRFDACRTEFMRFTMATDLVFRRYYPQWC